MQSKISSFFKSSATHSSNASQLFDPVEDTLLFNTTNEPEIRITYSRRTPKSDLPRGDENDDKYTGETSINSDLVDAHVKSVFNSGKVVNKKRSYAQFYLEFGQADFVLHNCSICGLKYTRGEEGDEEVHKEFHKNYTHGIPFKGWRNERLIPMNLSDNSRIVLMLDCDTLSQKNKVQEVAKMMEKELGLSEGWLLHKLCKVYLFISARRIAGCLVAEPIQTGYKVVSSSRDGKQSKCANKNADKSIMTYLQFGNVNFRREVVRKATSVFEDQGGAIICEEEAVPATCGVRAIWVSHSKRRKHVATKLLDAARTSFCTGCVLEHSQLAFSQPTSAGKALAWSYSGTESYFVYNTGLAS